MLGDIDRERRLAHRGPAREDDQISGLEAGGQAVKIGVARRQARDRAGLAGQGIDPVAGLGDQVRDRSVLAQALPLPLGDLKNRLLRFIEHLLAGLALRIEHGLMDPGRGLDQLPEHRALADNLGIGPDIGRGRRVIGQRREVPHAAGLIQQLMILQPLGGGDDVGGFPGLRERGKGAEDNPMVVAIKITLLDPLGHLVPGVLVEENSAQHGLLGLNGMRRDFERRGLGCGGGGRVYLIRHGPIILPPLHPCQVSERLLYFLLQAGWKAGMF